jgi:hypothetical protein
VKDGTGRNVPQVGICCTKVRRQDGGPSVTNGTCERQDRSVVPFTPCTAPATRTYVRTDWPHYDPGDPRADVPIEVIHTCDHHPMGDGLDGRTDYGWRRASSGPHRDQADL